MYLFAYIMLYLDPSSEYNMIMMSDLCDVFLNSKYFTVLFICIKETGSSFSYFDTFLSDFYIGLILAS